jgi:hypothetical protein
MPVDFVNGATLSQAAGQGNGHSNTAHGQLTGDLDGPEWNAPVGSSDVHVLPFNNRALR